MVNEITENVEEMMDDEMLEENTFDSTIDEDFLEESEREIDYLIEDIDTTDNGSMDFN